MLQRLKNLESNFTISKAALIVGFFTFLAKLVAFVRDPLFSSKFGGENIYILDIYNAAFRIPDFISNLLILGTLAAAFIPIYIELVVKDKEHAGRLASTVFNSVCLGISLICLVTFIFARPFTHLLVPGFGGAIFDQTVKLTRLFLLSPIIFGASSIFTNILYANKKFIIAGLAPLFYNLGIIFGVLFLYDSYGIMGLGYGVILGAALHLLIQLPSAIANGFSWQPILDFKDLALRKMLKLYIPRIFSLDISHISLIVSTIIGSHLASGSIAIFNLANNLHSVPIGIFGISFAIAAFPSFSESFARKDEQSFVQTLYKTIFQIMFFALPLSVAFLLYRAHIVRLYLGHGNFTWENTILTFSVLGALSFSLFSQSLTPLLTRAFYGRQNTIIPVIINLVSMVLNGSLAYVFAKHYGVVGLAAGFSIASIFNTICLFIILHHMLSESSAKNGVSLGEYDKNLIIRIFKILTASVLMGGVGYLSLRLLEPFVNNETFVGLFLQTGGSALLAGITFLAAALILKLKPAENIMNLIKRIFGFFYRLLPFWN